MKIKFSYFIILIVGIFLLVGCGASSIATTQPKIPEPYTKMLDQLNSNDLDTSEKYADLVISDFSNSDYVYNAQLVKNAIVSSRLGIENIKYRYIAQGIMKKSVLMNKADIDNVKNYSDTILSNIQKYNKDFELTTRYLLDYFSNSKTIPITMPTTPENMNPPNDNDFSSLPFFAKVGYPAPNESDITYNDKNNSLKEFYKLTNGNSFSYSDYFYNISILIGDNQNLRKELLNKVIEITENDQYNKTRILAQNALSKIK